MRAAPRPHGAQVPDRARDATCCAESGAHLQCRFAASTGWPWLDVWRNDRPMTLRCCGDVPVARLGLRKWRRTGQAAASAADRDGHWENHGAAPNGDKPCFQMRTSRRECTITPKAYPLRQVLGGSRRMVEKDRHGQSFVVVGKIQISPVVVSIPEFPQSFLRPRVQLHGCFDSTSPTKKKERQKKKKKQVKPTAIGSSVPVPQALEKRIHWRMVTPLTATRELNAAAESRSRLFKASLARYISTTTTKPYYYYYYCGGVSYF